ncbi:MAG: hypothetical protein K9J50_03970 [Sulfuritalea sp.]|nr:hypothetical protein [Sulfuritalea sp.]
MRGQAKACVNLALAYLPSLVRVAAGVPYQFYRGCANALLVQKSRRTSTPLTPL